VGNCVSKAEVRGAKWGSKGRKRKDMKRTIVQFYNVPHQTCGIISVLLTGVDVMMVPPP